MAEKIIIIDFGSQFTQLIARAVREQNIYCEIIPYNKSFTIDTSIKGIILSGSPFSVNEAPTDMPNLATLSDQLPILGICFGAQLIAQQFGGCVTKSLKREYGRAILVNNSSDILLQNINNSSQVWMSHSDSITQLPVGFTILSQSDSIPVALFKRDNQQLPALYGIQFHPEVYHSIEGKKILRNFLLHVCKCHQDWVPDSFVAITIHQLQQTIGLHDNVVMALSGGVDSTVAAVLLQKAIGRRLHCLFVDNGLLRKNEYQEVLATYAQLNLNVQGIDAKALFYKALTDKTDPEEKRKIIGKLFIDVLQEAAKKIDNVKFLGQGTIYPDVIESSSMQGCATTIKSHHNVGGLPKTLNLTLVEPLRLLFKDEVRSVGKTLGVPTEMLARHPFPGPGLAIRILGAVTEEKVKLLQEADALYIQGLKKNNLYDTLWQAGAVLLPVKSVGVMGDERTYEYVLALRAVTGVDGMTADWAQLPYSFLANISNEIINNVRGINRVVYDISSKPPATIEWE